MADKRRVLDASEAAQILHIKRSTLLDWIEKDKDGILSIAHKTGGQWLFFEDDLLNWIASKGGKHANDTREN